MRRHAACHPAVYICKLCLARPSVLCVFYLRHLPSEVIVEKN